MTEPLTIYEDRNRRVTAPDLSVSGENLGTGWKRRWWSMSDSDLNEFLDTVFIDIAPGECRIFFSEEPQCQEFRE